MERTTCAAVECDVSPTHASRRDVTEVADETFYDQHLAPLETRMLRAVWRVLRDPDRSRDALQEALALIWRKRARVRVHPNPEALILRICLDVAVDMLRRERRRHRIVAASACAWPDPPSPPGPVEAAQERQLREQVLAAIATLPGKQAVAVLMRVMYEDDYPEIASALGCSETTARVHVARGRARLERLLAHLGGHPGGAP